MWSTEQNAEVKEEEREIPSTYSNSDCEFSNSKSVPSKKLTLKKYLYPRKLFKLEFWNEWDFKLITIIQCYE